MRGEGSYTHIPATYSFSYGSRDQKKSDVKCQVSDKKWQAADLIGFVRCFVVDASDKKCHFRAFGGNGKFGTKRRVFLRLRCLARWLRCSAAFAADRGFDQSANART